MYSSNNQLVNIASVVFYLRLYSYNLFSQSIPVSSHIELNTTYQN